MVRSSFDLGSVGLANAAQHWNLPLGALVEAAIRKGEGKLTNEGPFLAITTPHTGRSPKDRFWVEEYETKNDIWWGEVNKPLSVAHFEALQNDIVAYLNNRELFVRDMHASADPAERLRVRLVTENAWHSLFAYNMFIQPAVEALSNFVPDFIILHAPRLQADPLRHGVDSQTAIVINLTAGIVLIAGTLYAGEIKKSVFSILNYLLPKKDILPMHASANSGKNGNTAIFFGLSGTGKTTLSTDPNRGLIGDDEHGWSQNGIFNLEGGCYAKVIRLSAAAEPEIYSTLSRFGTILENVVIDPATRTLDLDDESLTENARASYPIEFIPNHVSGGMGGQPNNVFFLTADAFGVLPPISKLTPEQAMYHFISGYTAKLAGTERGVTEPEATFSACFGAPFMAWHSTVYAELLGQKIKEYGTNVWLVNTGWTGGPYGVGSRMQLGYTRAIIRAALDGSLDNAPTEPHPVFGIHMLRECPGVPDEVLNPRNTWADKNAYDAQAYKLAALFTANFEKFATQVPGHIFQAGPVMPVSS